MSALPLSPCWEDDDGDTTFLPAYIDPRSKKTPRIKSGSLVETLLAIVPRKTGHLVVLARKKASTGSAGMLTFTSSGETDVR